MGEDVVEGVLGGDVFAQDGVEGGDDDAEFLGNEVAGEVRFKALDDGEDVAMCLVEHLLVADVGDEDTVGGASVSIRLGNVNESFFEVVDANVVEGLELRSFVRDADDGLVFGGLDFREIDTWLGE